MKSCLDPTFRYTSSANTDLRKTFARIRKEQRQVDNSRLKNGADATSNVVPMQQRKEAAS